MTGMPGSRLLGWCLLGWCAGVALQLQQEALWPTGAYAGLLALAVVWFARRMDVVDHQGQRVYVTSAIFSYWPWLLKEVVVSAWRVSRIILDPKLPISPTLVRFKPGQKTPLGLVMHATSITLTPGTISVEADADEFLVHGLTRESALGVIDSEMDRRVTACEGNA